MSTGRPVVEQPEFSVPSFVTEELRMALKEVGALVYKQYDTRKYWVYPLRRTHFIQLLPYLKHSADSDELIWTHSVISQKEATADRRAMERAVLKLALRRAAEEYHKKCERIQDRMYVEGASMIRTGTSLSFV